LKRLGTKPKKGGWEEQINQKNSERRGGRVGCGVGGCAKKGEKKQEKKGGGGETKHGCTGKKYKGPKVSKKRRKKRVKLAQKSGWDPDLGEVEKKNISGLVGTGRPQVVKEKKVTPVGGGDGDKKKSKKKKKKRKKNSAVPNWPRGNGGLAKDLGG